MNEPERIGQRRFRSRLLRLALPIILLSVLPGDGSQELPNRQPRADAVAPLTVTPLTLPSTAKLGIVRLRGAWTLASPDRRFFGLSALAVDGGTLLALSDSGVLLRMPEPGRGREVRLHELPTGPGFPTFKKYRDSEALLRAADGGWFVTFEFRDSLWHYDRAFRRGHQIADLKVMHWPRNEGVEAVVGAPDGGLLLIPETQRGILLLRDGKASLLSLAGRTGGIADAVTLPDGRIVVAVREIGLGITNRLAWLEPDGRGYRLKPFARLPLGWTDNVEGLAAAPLPGGATRLWAVTDNDGWRRTVLVELELPRTTKAPAQAGAL